MCPITGVPGAVPRGRLGENDTVCGDDTGSRRLQLPATTEGADMPNRIDSIDTVLRQAEDEETEIFPAAQEAFGDEVAARLDRSFRATKRRVAEAA